MCYYPFIMQRIFAFIRREAVFCIAALCALVSAFFVPPTAAYLSYIDWDTLFILFSLMAVIAALRDCGVFDRMAYVLCGHIHQLRLLCAVLVLLCFGTSMLITNDVALLTFVPFTLALLGAAASGRVVLRTVVLETVAANMGSMLTPLGNPQNLFLFSKMGIGIGRFMLIILPYSAVSLGLLCLSLRLIPRIHLSVSGVPAAPAEPAPRTAATNDSVAPDGSAAADPRVTSSAGVIPGGAGQRPPHGMQPRMAGLPQSVCRPLCPLSPVRAASGTQMDCGSGSVRQPPVLKPEGPEKRGLHAPPDLCGLLCLYRKHGGPAFRACFS